MFTSIAQLSPLASPSSWLRTSKGPAHVENALLKEWSELHNYFEKTPHCVSAEDRRTGESLNHFQDSDLNPEV